MPLTAKNFLKVVKIVQGVVAAGHPLTAEAGAQMLKQGGNAVDAAVAAAFTSFIVEPALVNIGGGGIAQIYNPTTGQSTSYDFFSTMPGLPSLAEQADNGLKRPNLDFRKISVDFGAAEQNFYIGRGSVAVPGAVAGLCTMIDEAGRLPLPKILAPAIWAARNGVNLNQGQAYCASLLTAILTDTPEIAAIFAPAGRLAQLGEPLRFSALADSLERLGHEGPDLFYTGAIGAEIVRDQRERGGLITERDLSGYQVYRQSPIAVAYRNHTILLPPPSSDGGPLIAFALTLLNDYPLPQMAHNQFEHLRVLAEVMRLTNVARGQWEQDGLEPTNSVGLKSVDGLLSEAKLEAIRQQLAHTLAGKPTLAEPDLPQGPSNTTHISVADAEGTVVSITTSAGENAGFVVGHTGVMLNNMLGELDLHPSGFHQLPPGRRLSTMMSPVIVLHEGQPVLAVGSGGSNRLRSAILQTISNVIDFGLPLAEAVNAPRIHFEENVLQLEGGIDPPVAEQFEALNYTVNRWSERNMFFGGAHAVARQGQTWTAVGDARRGGAVAILD